MRNCTPPHVHSLLCTSQHLAAYTSTPPAYTSPCIYNHPLACTRRLCTQAPACTYNPSCAYTNTSLHIQVPPCLYKHLPSYMYKRTPAYTSSLLHTQPRHAGTSIPLHTQAFPAHTSTRPRIQAPLAYTSIPCIYISARLHIQKIACIHKHTPLYVSHLLLTLIHIQSALHTQAPPRIIYKHHTLHKQTFQ
jgi:hypothetical protein